MLNSTLFLLGYFVFVLVHLVGEFLLIKGKNSMVIRYISKPFLMPLLAGFYIVSAHDPKLWVILGLAGGMLGDISLMIPDSTKKFFRIGLVAFLLGHIFYIVALINGVFSFQLWSLLLAIPYIIIGIVVYPKLIVHTGKMKTAVTVYLIVIILMGVCSTFLLGNIKLAGLILLMVGALLFIISDTINAFNKFAGEIPYERLLTMSTYLSGQLLLILGFLYL